MGPSLNDDAPDLRRQLQAMESWLAADRERREDLLVVKQSLNSLNSQYSFLREDGLRRLLKLLLRLQSTKHADWDDPGFLRAERTDVSDIGNEPDVTVTESILREVFPKVPVPSAPHLCATSAAERQLAMACLEGLAVLSRREQKAFFMHRGVLTVKDELARHSDLLRPRRDPDLRRAQQERMQSVTQEAVPLMCASLDALLVGCLDSPEAQGQVMDMGLPTELCEVLTNRAAHQDLRYKIIEFLSVLLRLCDVGITPDSARGPRGDQRPAGERLRNTLAQQLGADVLRKLPQCVSIAPSGQGKSSSKKQDLLLTHEILETVCSRAA